MVDKPSWEHCKRKQLLEACASEYIDLSRQHPGLCVTKNARLTLSLRRGTLASLLSIMYGAYVTVCIRLSSYDPNHGSTFTRLVKMVRQGWVQFNGYCVGIRGV